MIDCRNLQTLVLKCRLSSVLLEFMTDQVFNGRAIFTLTIYLLLRYDNSMALPPPFVSL